VVFLVLSASFSAQQQGIAEFPDTCESSVANLVGVASKIKTIRNEAPGLILIASSPKGVSQVYDRQRINAAIDYFFRVFRISKDQIVWGIGENSKKLSYLRFYIPGEPTYEVKMTRRGRLCTSAEQVP
jgi:hypothetical protein